MEKSAATEIPQIGLARREPRPFLYLEPQPVPVGKSERIEGIDELASYASEEVPVLVRSLVNFTIARQNRDALRDGTARPIPLSVLNRRRRSARAWVLAILTGQVDAAVRHAVTRTWAPHLGGTGTDMRRSARAGRDCVEFLRGVLTACIFDQPAENLVPAAKALHALERVLGVHLQALRDSARREFTGS